MNNNVKIKVNWNFIITKLMGLLLLLGVLYFLLNLVDYTKNAETTWKDAIKKARAERAAEAAKKAKQKLTFRDGDIIFQHVPGRLGEHISEITESPLNHCGIIDVIGKEIFVIEASDTVVKTPLKEWISRGSDKRFSLYRLKESDDKKADRIVSEAEKMLNLPYDNRYQDSDKRIYCSELVFKAYKRGAKVQPGKFIPLKEMKYKGHEDFIRSYTGGELPLERKIISPVEISRYNGLEAVYDDFREPEKKAPEKKEKKTEEKGSNKPEKS